MLTPHYVSQVTCHMSHVTCHMSHNLNMYILDFTSDIQLFSKLHDFNFWIRNAFPKSIEVSTDYQTTRQDKFSAEKNCIFLPKRKYKSGQIPKLSVVTRS